MKTGIFLPNKAASMIKEAEDLEDLYKVVSHQQYQKLEKVKEKIVIIITRLKRESFTIESYPDNSKYYGQKSPGEKSDREGIGEYKYESGAIYEGEWKIGIRSGLGRCSFSSGNQYDGLWKNGMRNGLGEFFYKKSGDTYVGEFVDDGREGFGLYGFGNGGHYVGEWFQNKRVGKGVMVFNDGSKYIGDWKKNRRDGNGVFFVQVNEKNVLDYCGEWSNNKRNGIGTIKEDSDLVTALWEDDVFIEKIEVDLFVLKKGLVQGLKSEFFTDCIINTTD